MILFLHLCSHCPFLAVLPSCTLLPSRQLMAPDDDDDDDAAHWQLHSFRQPMCWSLFGYPVSSTRRWSPSGNCRKNYIFVFFNVYFCNYWMGRHVSGLTSSRYFLNESAPNFFCICTFWFDMAVDMYVFDLCHILIRFVMYFCVVSLSCTLFTSPWPFTTHFSLHSLLDQPSYSWPIKFMFFSIIFMFSSNKFMSSAQNRNWCIPFSVI